jgi:hypothetical protein
MKPYIKTRFVDTKKSPHAVRRTPGNNLHWAEWRGKTVYVERSVLNLTHCCTSSKYVWPVPPEANKKLYKKVGDKIMRFACKHQIVIPKAGGVSEGSELYARSWKND